MSGWPQQRNTAERLAAQPPTAHWPGLIAATNNHMSVRLAGTAKQPVAAVIGDIDQDNGADLQRALTAALDASPRALTIDMTGVGFTDSTGLNVLLRMRERARQASKILSLRPGRCLARLLDVTETGGLFTIAR